MNKIILEKNEMSTSYSQIISEIREQYLEDPIPWVIGFSGGKDSTTVLQMVFYALSTLPKKKLNKEIHVISNDTLVENPAIIEHVEDQLKKIERSGKRSLFKHNPNLFKVIRVEPELNETFWVNLIGRGYPSPNRWFRWCTERMKINPTNKYIIETVNKNKNSKSIIVLGTRKAESSNRSAAMNNYDNGNRLRKHSLSNVFVYAPIADLTNHEVWAYLLQSQNPWGANNRYLLNLYQNASDAGECPFFIETGSQSCGKSRFGCWVCTVVDRDKSMENFIKNGSEWMKDLLAFRNWIYDIRRETYQYVPNKLKSKAKFGPFLLRTREELLNRLLGIQKQLSRHLIKPEEVQFIKVFLEKESEGKVKDGLRKFVYEFPNGKRIATISDFDLLLTPRKRLGPLFLNKAKLINSSKVSRIYKKSTRVMYHFIEN